jgi:photosystem II stability/assembly factor-like uncharacterized protein
VAPDRTGQLAFTLSIAVALTAGCAALGPTSPPTLAPGTPLATPGGSTEPSDAASTGGIAVAAMAWFDRNEGLLLGANSFENARGVLWRTTDGGRSWSKSALATGPVEAASIAGDSVWAAVPCSSGEPGCEPGIWRSTDRGTSWERVSSAPVIALSFGDPDHGWAITSSGAVAGGDESVLLSTSDGGRHWTQRATPCPPWTGAPAAITFPDATHGWLACDEDVGAGNALKAIVATSDGGESWQVRASSPWPGKGPVIGRLGGNGYLHGLAMRASGVGMNWQGRGITQKTMDGGVTWENIPPGEFDVTEASAGWMLDDRTWLMYLSNAADGMPAVEITTDAGATWTVVSVIPPPES